LLVGTWFGRARSLVAVGAVTTLALVAVATVDIPLRGGVGERDHAPVSVAEVDSPYRLAVGDLRLDLADLPVPLGTTEVVASVAVGQLVVLVPDDADLVVTAHAGLGNVATPDGANAGGFSTDRTYRAAGAPGAGTLELDLQVGVGQVEVRRVPA
jgi:predicted membrane protein